jgi:hypothetical protein
MGSHASHQPLKVFSTVCERGTGLDLLDCIDAHNLLWTSPVPDSSISQRLGDLSNAFKGCSHAPSLLVIVWFDHRAPSVPAKLSVHFLASSCPPQFAARACYFRPLFEISLGCELALTVVTFVCSRCVQCTRIVAGQEGRHWSAQVRAVSPPGPRIFCIVFLVASVCFKCPNFAVHLGMSLLHWPAD